jgi:hypothetical protein
MPPIEDKLAALLAYVAADGRICPMPDVWHAFWESLPSTKDTAGAYIPGLPLILTGWHLTSNADKQERLREQIEYAATNGVLDQADGFLRGIAIEQWKLRGQ